MVMMADDIQGEVCDAFVPPHLNYEETLRDVIGAPVDASTTPKHDPLCRQKYHEWEPLEGFCPDCDLINKVKKREQQMKEYIANTSKRVGYLEGRREATEAVEAIRTKGGNGTWLLRSKAIEAARGTDS
jgi:hypothetical protein